MATIKGFVIDVLKDKLDEHEGNFFYGCDLAYDLLQQYNVDGSYTYNNNKAMLWVQEHFNELADIVDDMTEEGLPPVNVFKDVEGFMVSVMLYVANDLLGQCETVTEVWNDEFILDTETINKIKEELNTL